MKKITKSRIKQHVEYRYQVQRRTKGGRWTTVIPVNDFSSDRNGLKLLRMYVKRLEYPYYDCKHRARKLGRLRVVKVKTITTRQTVFIPTRVKKIRK